MTVRRRHLRKSLPCKVFCTSAPPCVGHWLYIPFGQRRLNRPAGSGLRRFSTSSQPTHVPCSCAETPPPESGYLRSSVSLRPAHPPSVAAGEQEASVLGKEPEPREAQEQMLKWDGGTQHTLQSSTEYTADTPLHKNSFSRPVKAENKCHNTWRKLTQPTVTCKLQTLGDLSYWETVQEKTTSGVRTSCRSSKKENALSLACSGASTLILKKKKKRGKNCFLHCFST